jgi:hypothetical protein
MPSTATVISRSRRRHAPRCCRSRVSWVDRVRPASMAVRCSRASQGCLADYNVEPDVGVTFVAELRWALGSLEQTGALMERAGRPSSPKRSRALRLRPAGLLALMVLVAVAAACGSPAPPPSSSTGPKLVTASLTASPTAPPTVSGLASPTAPPSASPTGPFWILDPSIAKSLPPALVQAVAALPVRPSTGRLFDNRQAYGQGGRSRHRSDAPVGFAIGASRTGSDGQPGSSCRPCSCLLAGRHGLEMPLGLPQEKSHSRFR